MLLQINTPIPKDLPLDLPLPEWLLVGLLVFSFLLHILFINLMVGGSIITLWAQIKGLKNKESKNNETNCSTYCSYNPSNGNN